jgi:hypothetical protein
MASRAAPTPLPGLTEYPISIKDFSSMAKAAAT